MSLNIISRAEAKTLGLASYFLGPDHPCPKGHLAERNTAEGKCRDCMRESYEKVRRKKGMQKFEPNVARAEAIKNGERKFSDGKACCHGHLSQRWTHNGACVECSQLASKEFAKKSGYASQKNWINRNPDRVRACRGTYRILNADKIKAQGIAYRATNADQVKARRDAYLAANGDKAKASSAAWVKANPEKVKATKDRYRSANVEKEKASYAAWAKANPEMVRAKVARRRAIKLAAEGSHAAAEIADLLQNQKCKCANCRAPLKGGYHADHITPLSKGGSNWISNIQLLCPACNLRKGAKDPIRFAQENGRLL